MSTHRYSLDTSGTKFKCPQCGRQRFVRYFDKETNKYLAEHVGRCDRENSCSYHYSPKEYFAKRADNFNNKTNIKSMAENTVSEELQFMPMEYWEKSMEQLESTNFYKWLENTLGKEAREVAIQYSVGRSIKVNSNATIFWRININYELRAGKIMHYNADTGQRIKEVNPTWVHKSIPNFNFHQHQLCFFGEHLLNHFPDSDVGIVESEKTAIVMRVFIPEILWLATGGQSGCKWRDYEVYKVLKGRKVIWFPDYGFANKKTGKTCAEWSDRVKTVSQRMEGNFRVSNLLEQILKGQERADQDLADLLIQGNNVGDATQDYRARDLTQRYKSRDTFFFEI